MRRHKGIIIAALFTIALFAAACGPAVTEVPMPRALIGHWTTSNPAYANRYFEFSADTLVLGTSALTSERYAISRVLQDQDDTGVLYTVEYADTLGGDYAMSFYFDAAGRTLRLENQTQFTWRKRRGGS